MRRSFGALPVKTGCQGDESEARQQTLLQNQGRRLWQTCTLVVSGGNRKSKRDYGWIGPAFGNLKRPWENRSVPLVFSVNSISTWKSILRASRTLGAQKYVQLYVLYITLIPRLPHCPVFDHLQCMQTEGGGGTLYILSHEWCQCLPRGMIGLSDRPLLSLHGGWSVCKEAYIALIMQHRSLWLGPWVRLVSCPAGKNRTKNPSGNIAHYSWYSFKFSHVQAGIWACQ